MRNLYIVLFSLLVVSCSSVPKTYLANNDLCMYNDSIFTISLKDITFDIKQYGEKLQKQRRITLQNNKDFKNEYWLLSTGYIINKKTYKKNNIGKWIGFNKEGRIESVNFIYEHGDNEVYKKILYNDKGDIEKIINHDQGYRVCWLEAIAIVKKIARYKIKKYGVTNFYLRQVNLNEFPQAKPMWLVGFLEGNKKLLEYREKHGYIRYKIDGITGNFLGAYHVIMEHN